MRARVALLIIVACAVGLPPATGTAAAARERVFTVVGEGGYGTSGDGGLASRADVTMAGDLAALPDGGFLFIDGDRVRRVAPDGRISTVAGGGDGPTPATRAMLDQPTGVAAMPDGGFVVAERVGRVRRIDASGAITTVAGGGVTPADPGEGRPATEVTFSEPVSVAAQADGSFLVATAGLVRRVGPDGIVTRVAGRRYGPGTPPVDTRPSAGDGGPATDAMFELIVSVAADPRGGFLVVDQAMHRVRRVRADGVIETVAGVPLPAGSDGGFSGDGGPATAAALNRPVDAAVAPDGSIVIADYGNNRVRRVAPDGTIRTVAGAGPGTWVVGLRGTGQSALSIGIVPSTVAVAATGELLVSQGGEIVAVTTGAAGERLLGLGIRPAAVRAGRSRVTAAVRSSIASALRVEVRRGGRVIARSASRAPGHGAAASVSLRRRWQPGIHVLTVTGTAAGGFRAQDAQRLVLGGRLTVSAARRALDEFGFVFEEEEPENGYSARTRIGACQIVGDRVDCRIEVELNDEPFRCDAIVATRLRPTGQLRTRRYQCGRFRAAPRWFPDSEWQEQTLRRP